MDRVQLLAAVVLGVVLAACGEQDVTDESAPSDVTSPSTATAESQPSPTPSAATSPGSTECVLEAAQTGLIFFLRPPEELWSFEAQLAQSELWVADACGNGERQISSGKTNVSFAGFLVAEDGPVVYYASGNETTFHLWRKALETGAETEVLSFSPSDLGPNYGAAAVSPDGRQAAFVEGGDITLADLATGERRIVLQGEKPEPHFGKGGPYFHPKWSPDGSLLAVKRMGWEWSFLFIVDPSVPTVLAAISPSDIGYTGAELDWGTSDEACATVGSTTSSGLYLLHGPDWAFDPDEAEEITGYCPDPSDECSGDVRQCAWLDEKRIAFSVVPYGSNQPRIEVIDTADTHAITALMDLPEEPGVSSYLIDMFVLRDQGLIVYNRYHDEERRHGTFTTVGVTQVADGTSMPILRERDHVVALAESPRGLTPSQTLTPTPTPTPRH